MNIIGIHKNKVSFNGHEYDITNSDIDFEFDLIPKNGYSIIKSRSLDLFISLLDIPIISSNNKINSHNKRQNN